MGLSLATKYNCFFLQVSLYDVFEYKFGVTSVSSTL